VGMELAQCFAWQVSRRSCYHYDASNHPWELKKLESPLCVKFASFHCTTLEISRLWNNCDWLLYLLVGLSILEVASMDRKLQL
jgi:hypothetical protein